MRDGTTKSLFSRLPDWAILLLFCSLLLAQRILSLRAKSGTSDETARLPAGYLHLKFGNYGFNPEQPPLVKMLAALPLLLIGVKMPSQEALFGGPRFAGALDDFRFGHQLFYEENDPNRLLFLGRPAVLPLTPLLAAILGMGLLAYLTICATYRFRHEAIALSGQGYAAQWDQILPDHTWLKAAILRRYAGLAGSLSLRACSCLPVAKALDVFAG